MKIELILVIEITYYDEDLNVPENGPIGNIRMTGNFIGSFRLKRQALKKILLPT
ncbi:hypothetical protein [Chryseobacterium sp. JK1]|uniref:hypothetical protein n=1 Tax=Chryseobacterium sp. JK1 TaxID=874294 RepID=UPI003D68DC70